MNGKNPLTRENPMTTINLEDSSLFRQQCYINGQWLDADSGKTVKVTNPADGSVIASVPYMGSGEAASALELARDAQVLWRETLAKERSDILQRWHGLMLENQRDLAVLMTLEQGKPIAESMGEIVYAASFIEWFASEARRTGGEIIPQHQQDKRVLVIKQPVGVCTAITPWNFPSAMITRKVGPALAAGCAMVVKPATQTPLSALALCELAERSGLPPGVLNVITGSSPDIGLEMTTNPIVRHFSFTGSTEIGRLLMQQCSGTIIKVALELGGNAPFIVFDDADIDAAVEGAMVSKYRNTGQTCVCANRIYVQDSVYDEFADKLARAVTQMKVGSGMDEGVSQGPLIDSNAVEKVEEHIRDAVSKGAEVVVGGGRHELGGTFFEPTLLRNVTPQMKVAREETFGPLAPLFRFGEEEEAIRMANDTEFGLASYFYSNSLDRVWRVSEQLEYGMVGINTGIISTEVAPFGGIKQSGLGREGSSHGIDEYLEMKYLCMGGIL